MNNTENYPTWLVPLEIAKQLKAIGFDYSCPFILSDIDEVIISSEEYIDESLNGIIDIEVTIDNDLNFVNNKYTLVIPTWTDVFAWFRSKGYHSTLHTYSVMLGNVEEFRFYYEINSCHDYIANPKKDYDNYEDAREALVIKLIEIYKNK